MHVETLIEVTWRPRFTPLVPVGAVAQESAATKLAHRLLQAPEDLPRLKGVSAPGLLVILGEEELLPWVNEVVYLGRDSEAPSLLIPTNLEPSVPLSLLERAITTYHAGIAPCAVLPNPPSIIPLVEARPLAKSSLVKWLEADL
jgi:hypothetical protein